LKLQFASTAAFRRHRVRVESARIAWKAQTRLTARYWAPIKKRKLKTAAVTRRRA
jgi:hypothetical protein